MSDDQPVVKESIVNLSQLRQVLDLMGFGTQREEKHVTYTQAYEIATKVGAEVDSKGNVKPHAQVQITRRLKSGDQITELIHADISRGVEESMDAIREILAKANGGA